MVDPLSAAADSDLDRELWRALETHGVTCDVPAALVGHLHYLFRAYATGDAPEIAAARRDLAGGARSIREARLENLAFLIDTGQVTSQDEAARRLGVTPRTISRYVRELDDRKARRP